jgi:hypothetical protein
MLFAILRERDKKPRGFIAAGELFISFFTVAENGA